MRHEVAVIGAGPGGAWTAYCLARRGARVVLADPSHPREKPCGGGVTGRALAMVAGAFPSTLPAVAIRSARFVDTVTGATASVPLDDSRSGQPLTVASRTAFDGRLLAAARAAGVEFTSSRVTAVASDGAGFRVDTADGRTRAVAVVVGADGANSLVRRRLATAFRRDQLSIATGFFATGATADEIVLEFVADPPGYLWSFPRPDHLAIGICAQAGTGVTAEALRTRAAAWMRAAGLAHGCSLQPYSWPIPSLSAPDFEALDVAGPGWFLVGDAAGLVDPITREGILYALQSGQYAADAIASRAPDAHRAYAERVRRDITTELARAARFKARFFRPAFTRLMMDALSTSPAIGRVVADLVAGTQGYRGLKWRLVKTGEAALAWNLLRTLA